VATYRAFVRVALNDDNLVPGLTDIVAAPPDAVIYLVLVLPSIPEFELNWPLDL
jgi:hypothetical protein